jgi:hypothetical protein
VFESWADTKVKYFITSKRETIDAEYKPGELYKRELPCIMQWCSVFKEVGSFRGVGKLYGVSDKAIVKWFKHYNLPTSKEELKKYLEM